MADNITNKQLSDALFEAYKSHGANLREVMHSPVFSNLPLSSKVSLVKRYAGTHQDESRFLPEGSVKGIIGHSAAGAGAGALASAVYTALKAGIKGGITGNPEQVGRQIVARSSKMAIPAAVIGAYLYGTPAFEKARAKQKSKNNLAEELKGISQAKDDDEATHKALVFLSKVSPSAPAKEAPTLNAFKDTFFPGGKNPLAKAASFTTVRKLIKDV